MKKKLLQLLVVSAFIGTQIKAMGPLSFYNFPKVTSGGILNFSNKPLYYGFEDGKYVYLLDVGYGLPVKDAPNHYLIYPTIDNNGPALWIDFTKHKKQTSWFVTDYQIEVYKCVVKDGKVISKDSTPMNHVFSEKNNATNIQLPLPTDLNYLPVNQMTALTNTGSQLYAYIFAAPNVPDIHLIVNPFSISDKKMIFKKEAFNQ